MRQAFQTEMFLQLWVIFSVEHDLENDKQTGFLLALRSDDEKTFSATHSFTEFFSDEWFEDSKQHVEQIRIIDDMNRF